MLFRSEFLSRKKKKHENRMGNAASILQSLVQSPEDRLFGYLQAIRHVMDDPTVEKPTPSVSGALLEACFVYVFVSEITRLYFTRKGHSMDSFFMFELLEYEHTIHQSKVYITRISQNIQTLKRQPPTLKR